MFLFKFKDIRVVKNHLFIEDDSENELEDYPCEPPYDGSYELNEEEDYNSYPDDIDCLDDGGGMDMGYMDDPDYEE